MSIDVTTYIGPFASCKVENQKVSQTYFGCGNAGCSGHGREVWGDRVFFCSRCGKEICTLNREVEQDSIDREEVSEAFQEALTYPSWGTTAKLLRNRHVWIPNQKRGEDQPYRFFDPYEEEVLEPVCEEDIDEAYKWFEKNFCPELNILRGFYGNDNVVVLWGVISYIH